MNAENAANAAPHAAEERRFFLAGAPADGRARLAERELHHALHVIRLRHGERVWGLDGAGRAWPLRVLALGRRELELEVAGPAVTEPAPGESGAVLPYFELAVSLPRGNRAEQLIDHSVQLGLAAWTPLSCERTQGGARELSAARLERLDRAAAEACKQSRSLWLPERRDAISPADLAARGRTAQIALLAPRAAETLLEHALRWKQSGRWPGRERPLVIAVGPEGGFTDAEEGALRDAGAEAVALGPHILRVETAAEAALAALVQVFFRRGAAGDPELDIKRSQNDMRSRSDT